MLNVFSDDVHKNIIENIENDKPLNYIKDYELEYQEGLPTKIDIRYTYIFSFQKLRICIF